MKRWMLAVALAICATRVASEDVRYYDVEVVIFEQLGQWERDAETWPVDVEQTAPEIFVELGRPYPGPLPEGYNPKYTFKPLSQADLRLVKEAKALER